MCSIRALTDAGFIVDTARNGFIGLNKMLSSTFPNTPTCFSSAPTPAPAPVPVANPPAVAAALTVDSKSITEQAISSESCSKSEDKVEGVQVDGKEVGAGVGSKHLVVDTSLEATTAAETSPEVIKPFDYILMDIQMPVMGKKRTHCHL